MSTPVRLLAFAAGLGMVLLAGLGIGSAVGPVGDASDDPAHAHDGATDHDGAADDGADRDGADHDGGDPAGHAAGDGGAPGLSSSQAGYTLRLASSTHPLRRSAPFTFTVTGPDAQPLTSYTTAHEKDLHLVLVRRDGTGFQHVHPALDDDGSWSLPLTVRTAGAYKVFADFVPAGGEPLTLGADFSVAGRYDPEPVPGNVRDDTVRDATGAYSVHLEGDLAAGSHSELRFTVRHDGEPVDDLEPYLGAYGHLVALRADDLAYLHVHPDGAPDDGTTAAGPDIAFAAEVPTDGAYRLYLDFKHRGVVRTAELTLWAGEPGGTTAAPSRATSRTPIHGDEAHRHEH